MFLAAITKSSILTDIFGLSMLTERLRLSLNFSLNGASLDFLTSRNISWISLGVRGSSASHCDFSLHQI